MAKELNKNKTEQKNITQKLPGPYLAATHSPTLCSPPTQAQPTSSPLSSSSPRTEAARWRAPMPPRPPPASTEAFPSLPLTPRVPSPLFLPRCSLSLPRTLSPSSVFPHPNGAAVTDESHRGYRPPHGSPTPRKLRRSSLYLLN